MRIEFLASLPPIQSAIQLDGLGDGGRVKLDVSREYVAELVALQKMSGKNIRIIAEAEDVPPDYTYPEDSVSPSPIDWDSVQPYISEAP